MIATPNMRHTPTNSSTSGFHPSTSQHNDLKQEESNSNNVLYLEKSPIQFKSPSTNLNLYLDECNKEIISISRNQELGTTIVEIQPILGRAKLISLKLPIKKKILSLKFSPDRSVLAYHIEHNVLEFINLKKESDQVYSLGSKHYVRSCSAKNSKFYGFFWVAQIEIVIVTNISVEYYHVEPTKHRLKHIKTFSLSTNWFIHQPNHSMFEGSHRDSISGHKDYSVLMVSFGLGGSDVQPFVFQERDMQKMVSFEVEGNWRDSDQLEQSVTISRVYGEVRLLVLQHGATHNMKLKGSRILVYTLNLKTRLTSRTHILDFDTSGFFALNVVDDIIIGHHQASRTSFMFDILAKSTEMSDCPNQFVSLNNRQSIRPLYLEETKQNAELYSPNWVFIQPDFIINPQVGHLMILKLDLTLVSKLFYDNNVLIDFLTYRRKSENALYEKCKHIMDECYQAISGNSNDDASHKSLSSRIKTCPLIDVSLMLEIVNRITKSAPAKANANKPRDQSEEMSMMKVAINQEEFYQNVFKSFVEKASSQGLDSLVSIF